MMQEFKAGDRVELIERLLPIKIGRVTTLLVIGCRGTVLEGGDTWINVKFDDSIPYRVAAHKLMKIWSD